MSPADLVREESEHETAKGEAQHEAGGGHRDPDLSEQLPISTCTELDPKPPLLGRTPCRSR